MTSSNILSGNSWRAVKTSYFIALFLLLLLFCWTIHKLSLFLISRTCNTSSHHTHSVAIICCYKLCCRKVFSSKQHGHKSFVLVHNLKPIILSKCKTVVGCKYIALFYMQITCIGPTWLTRTRNEQSVIRQFLSTKMYTLL